MVFSSLPLVAIPVVYSVVTSYNQSGSLDPLSPSPPLKVDLSILPEMLLLALITRVGYRIQEEARVARILCRE